MSEARKGKNNPMFGRARSEGAGSPPQKIEVFDKETNKTTIFESISEAEIALNIPRSSINSYFAHNQKKAYKNRYIFKKVKR
jgi:hypothetical protein